MPAVLLCRTVASAFGFRLSAGPRVYQALFDPWILYELAEWLMHNHYLGIDLGSDSRSVPKKDCLGCGVARQPTFPRHALSHE